MSEDEQGSEPVETTFPKFVPKREAGNSMEPESIESEVPDLSQCPKIPDYVRSYETCCKEYSEGKQTDLDVLSNVIESLKKLRK
ncbi:hypothetical protein MUP77_14765 [Candidatus Bathyarchaeota archaeon]|nr:hypothetical protein [Candidatus Bathyarchaeota archaeon]